MRTAYLFGPPLFSTLAPVYYLLVFCFCRGQCRKYYMVVLGIFDFVGLGLRRFSLVQPNTLLLFLAAALFGFPVVFSDIFPSAAPSSGRSRSARRSWTTSAARSPWSAPWSGRRFSSPWRGRRGRTVVRGRNGRFGLSPGSFLERGSGQWGVVPLGPPTLGLLAPIS